MAVPGLDCCSSASGFATPRCRFPDSAPGGDVFTAARNQARFPRSKSAAPERRRESEPAIVLESMGYAGSPAMHKRGNDWVCRYHSPQPVQPAECRGNGDLISHDCSAPAARPMRRMAQFDAGGNKAAGYNMGDQRKQPGSAGTRKCEFQPSDELKKHNNRGARDVQPSTPRKFIGSDLPPSEDLKRYNENKAYQALVKEPRAYAAGGMPPSSQLQSFNDKKRLLGAHRGTPAKQIHEQHFHSEGMRDCLVPPPNCPMSDRCQRPEEIRAAAMRSSRLSRDVPEVDFHDAATEYSSCAGYMGLATPSRASRSRPSESCGSADLYGSIACSDASGFSGVTRSTAKRRSDCSEATHSVTEGGSWASSRPATSRTESKPGRPLGLESDASSRSCYSESMCSRSQRTDDRSYATFTPAPRNQRPTSKDTRSLQSSRLTSRTSEYTESVASKNPPMSARTQSSFSYGGFDMSKVTKRCSA